VELAASAGIVGLSRRFHFHSAHCTHWANIESPSFLAMDEVSSAGFVEYL
jgi:hypothetical protein